MPHLIHWCGFAGAWLLVFGPLQQAATEIEDESQELDEIGAKLRALPQTEHPSAWWWLLPPVAYIQGLRRRHQQHQLAREALDADELEALQHLAEKARAWSFVAGGAFLIAITETWALRESYRWAEWAFWALMATMVLLCAGLTAYRGHRRRTRSRDGT
jgi:hypothetical protein